MRRQNHTVLNDHVGRFYPRIEQPLVRIGVGNVGRIATKDTPVVGFRAGGVPDSVHPGENGFLAEPQDEDSFLQHAETFCQDHGLRRKMSQAAWAYAQTQTWEHIFERLLDSYQIVLDTEGARGAQR